MASGKKPCARRDALRSCPQSGHRAAAARCSRALKPRARKSAALHAEFPHPFCASGPAGPGADQGTRFYQPRPVRRGQHHYCRAGGIARPRVSSAQMSGCRWLITGLTCAGPVRPVTPPARPPQGRQGRERHLEQPCPARRPDRCPEPSVSGRENRRGGPVQSAVLCRDGPPTAGRFHTGTFHTGTGVRQEIAGLHTATDTATDRSLYPGNFPPVFSLDFRRNPGETGWQHTARTASHTAGFLPCRSGAVLCRVISRLRIRVPDRDALSWRIYPRIHGKSLRAYFIIRFGYSGRRDPYP